MSISFEFPTLVEDDDEFINIAETILNKLKTKKRESNPPSWLRRTIKSLSPTKNRKRRQASNNENVENSSVDTVLTKDVLDDFKTAISFRLEEYESACTSIFDDAVDTSSSKIPILICHVLKHVDKYGWPEPDIPTSPISI